LEVAACQGFDVAAVAAVWLIARNRALFGFLFGLLLDFDAVRPLRVAAPKQKLGIRQSAFGARAHWWTICSWPNQCL